MQHEAPVGLHRAAEIHRHGADGRRQRIRLEGDIDALEQGGDIHVDGTIDDDAQGALLVVFANVSQGTRKTRIDHGGHGNQEVMG